MELAPPFAHDSLLSLFRCNSSFAFAMWLPPGLVARDAATTTTLTLQRIATAASLAASFNLSEVWSGGEATTADLMELDLANSSNAASWLLNNWQLESPLKPSSYNTLELAADPYDPASVSSGEGGA